MIALLMIGDNLKAPSTLEHMLKGDKVQPVEIGDLLEIEDLPDLKEFLSSINVDKIYVLYGQECQAIEVLKSSDLKIDAYFTAL